MGLTLTVYVLAFTGGPLDGLEVRVVDDNPAPLPGVYARQMGDTVKVSRTPRPGAHRYRNTEVGPWDVVLEYAPKP
jgi:hypothetical protein